MRRNKRGMNGIIETKHCYHCSQNKKVKAVVTMPYGNKVWTLECGHKIYEDVQR
jgi:hypothetical protein